MEGIPFQLRSDDPTLDQTERRVLAELEAKHGFPLSDEIQRFLWDTSASATVRVENMVTWSRRACELATSLESGEAHDAEYPLFWVHLYAVLVEMAGHLDKQREITSQVPFMRPVLEAVDRLTATADEQDIEFVRFMRHSAVHFDLSSVWHQVKVREGKITKVNPPRYPDARALAAEVISEYGGSQTAAACGYAARFRDCLCDLASAVETARSS